jgi:hypothetical protein
MIHPVSNAIGIYYNVQTPVRCYQCINNPTSNTTSKMLMYNTLKQIQKTVRVSSSQYTNELASLTATPKIFPTWNNMSDRDVPHVQHKRNASILSTYRPGTSSPGGIGCDIKHGSYSRYLNRLKGRSALRKEPIPDTFEIGNTLFKCANPIYGNKQLKTSVVSCPSCPNQVIPDNTGPEPSMYFQPYVFTIGQKVAIRNPITLQMIAGIILNYISENDSYIVNTDTGTIQVPSTAIYLVNC